MKLQFIQGELSMNLINKIKNPETSINNLIIEMIMGPVIIISIIFITSKVTAAESSFEVSCRIKAKELAAETYKNCVTEQKQLQLEQIRNDYKVKLNELKNHYDKELKKLNTKSHASDNSYEEKPKLQKSKSNQLANVANDEGPTIKLRKTKSSSLRNALPKKSIQTEAIDLSSPEGSIKETIITEESQNRMKLDNQTAQDTEIVELPTQE